MGRKTVIFNISKIIQSIYDNSSIITRNIFRPSMYGYMEWSSEVQKEANYQGKGCPTHTDIPVAWVEMMQWFKRWEI